MMTTVFCVKEELTCGYTAVAGIFATEKLAQEFINSKPWNYDYFIVEYPVQDTL